MGKFILNNVRLRCAAGMLRNVYACIFIRFALASAARQKRVAHLFINPEDGFTSAEIRDARRFVGRSNLIRDCIKALNSPTGLLAV